MTGRYWVLIEQPFLIDPAEIARSGRPLRGLAEYFSWQPRRGTRIQVVSRATGRRVLIATTDPLFFFHTINAFDDGDDIVVDLAAYDDPTIVKSFYLDRLRSDTHGFPTSTARRLRIDTLTGRVATVVLSPLDLELPTIDYPRDNGRPYRHTYGVGRAGNDETSFWNQLVKLDVTTGETTTWYETGTYPGEPVFVPAPQRGNHDDGVLLSVVLDHTTQGSFLLVLDAATLTEIARAHAPHTIPLGFHGVHVPAVPRPSTTSRPTQEDPAR